MHISGLWVTVTRYEGRADYSRQVTAMFERFKQGAVDTYLADFVDFGGLNHVEAGVLERVARLYPEVFAALDRHSERHADFVDATVATFDREVQFYLAYLDFIAPLRRAGLPFCHPETSSRSKEVFVRDTFDVALARKLVSGGVPVVRNDVALSGPERIIVVSGPNQGGKTTFARTFGQLHHLAGIGCPVPGSGARLYLTDRVLTHFAAEEALDDLRGQLQDDLVRIRKILDRATPRSVLVINELFSSTTLADATLLGTRILERIIAQGLLCVYVTFVDELASLGDATVSMVSTVEPHDPAVRTFRIVRHPADGVAHALAIADKHQLTYERVKERMSS
jgi:DNA mismatch repair ATPase MutS